MTPSEITEKIYKAYGTDSGFLFGIPPTMKSSVECIVKAVISATKDNKPDQFGCE